MGARTSVEPTAEVKRRALEIHRSATVVDTVNRSKIDERFFRDAKTGGFTILGRTILVSSGDVFSPFGFDETLRDIAQTLSAIDERPDELMLVRNGRALLRAKETVRIGFYIYFQSPEPLATDT